MSCVCWAENAADVAEQLTIITNNKLPDMEVGAQTDRGVAPLRVRTGNDLFFLSPVCPHRCPKW